MLRTPWPKDIVEDQVLTKHRSQAFSTAYFSGGRLFSYSRENLKASQVIAPERKPPGILSQSHCPNPEPEWRRLELQTLAGFILQPGKISNRETPGFEVPDEAAGLDEREAFA